MHQARDDEPARLARRADRFGRLERVLDLRQLDVGVAVVDKRVQEIERLPHGHRLSRKREVLVLLRDDERKRLVRVIEPVELFDAWTRVLVVAKVVGRFRQKRATSFAGFHHAPPTQLTITHLSSFHGLHFR